MTLIICQNLNHLLYKLARDLVSFGPEKGLYPQFDITVNHCQCIFQVHICQTRPVFRVVVVIFAAAAAVFIIVIIVVDHGGEEICSHIHKCCRTYTVVRIAICRRPQWD